MSAGQGGQNQLGYAKPQQRPLPTGGPAPAMGPAYTGGPPQGAMPGPGAPPPNLMLPGGPARMLTPVQTNPGAAMDAMFAGQGGIGDVQNAANMQGALASFNPVNRAMSNLYAGTGGIGAVQNAANMQRDPYAPAMNAFYGGQAGIGQLQAYANMLRGGSRLEDLLRSNAAQPYIQPTRFPGTAY